MMKIKPLGKFRLISHNFGGLFASVGTYLILMSILVEPALLSLPFQKLMYIIYLAAYPVLIALITIEDILFLWIRKKE